MKEFDVTFTDEWLSNGVYIREPKEEALEKELKHVGQSPFLFKLKF